MTDASGRGKAKVALVTGASQGIGRNIADTLARSGYRVFGTSRSSHSNRSGVDMRVLDFRDPLSIQDCVDQVEVSAGKIDLVVNNAGLTVVAPAEELPPYLAEDMMAVNFFGPGRLVNAVLPGMRNRKSGHFIFISSLGGLMGVPGQGYYCATKHALEGYADGLAAEIKSFGIDVTLLEPGSFETNIISKSPEPDWPTLEAYDGTRERLREVITQDTEKGGDPQLVADVVLRAASAARPGLRYRVDADGKRAVFFKSLLPERTFYSIVAKRFGM